jgi:hypothetical protein
MWFLGRRRRRPGQCVFCSRELNRKEQVAALKEHAVRELHGHVPADPPPFLDPHGNQRWFAHLTCMNSAALKQAGELDTTCVVCGRAVDAAERATTLDGLREGLGVEPPGPGRAPDPLDQFLTFVDAAVHAWQCQRCARWQCNRCVCAALTDGGPPIPDHTDCGGRFAPPS